MASENSRLIKSFKKLSNDDVSMLVDLKKKLGIIVFW